MVCRESSYLGNRAGKDSPRVTWPTSGAGAWEGERREVAVAPPLPPEGVCWGSLGGYAEAPALHKASLLPQPRSLTHSLVGQHSQIMEPVARQDMLGLESQTKPLVLQEWGVGDRSANS